MFVVGDIIRNNASKHPDKIGLVFEDNRFTWKETDMRVNCLAQGFIKLGLKKGDGVGILLRNCHQWVETALALAKLGLRMVPLNLRLEVRELSHIISDSEIRYMVVDATKKELVNRMLPDLSKLEGIIGCFDGHGFENDFETIIGENQPEDPFWPVLSEDIAVLTYTSGTTGKPKGAMLSHGNLSTAAVCEASEYRVIPTSITMTFIPLFFIGGWGATCLPYLLRGCTQYILGFEPEKILRLFHERKINATLMVPTMINILTNHPDARKYDYSKLKVVPFAGSPLPVEHWKRAVDVFGDCFVSLYGFTEGCGTVSILQPEEVGSFQEINDNQRMSSCGRPMIQTSMKLIREDGEEIPFGSDEIGEICVKGPTIFQGYWKHPDTTDEVLKDGWFYTGDLAHRDEEGFYYIVDRKKDMIITGGINVYPREIEEVIYTHEAVLDCSVIGVPDEKWGETIKAVVSLKPGKRVTPTEIIELCKANISSYKKPTSVEIVEDLPRTASGKILKRYLRDKHTNEKA